MGRTVTLYLVFLLSGIAGLGYQIVWTKMFTIGLGHEMPSVLAVVGAFFAGLAIGAWLLDRTIGRSSTPGRWYAVLEAVIGVWSLLTIWLIPQLNRLTSLLIGIDPGPLRHWFWAMVVPFIGLLPATAAMGATFAAMEQLVARLRRHGRAVGGIYAVNTAGAMAGTVLATFVLAPTLGYVCSILLLAGINFLCATGVGFGAARGERRRRPVEAPFDDRPHQVRLIGLLVATGFLGIGYEVLVVRVMAQVLENTVYSFASALSVYLLATAVGAAVYQRYCAQATFRGPLPWLLQALALACLGGILVLSRAGWIYEWLRAAYGGSEVASIVAEMGLALAVFGGPAMLMGATFSHLLQAARRARGGLGRALALNTIGSSVAPMVFGVIVLPLIGAKWALVALAAGYIALALPMKLNKLAPAGIAVAVALFGLPANLVLVSAPKGGRLVTYREGVMAAVAVVQDHEGDQLLKVNNRFNMGGTGSSAMAERRQTHLPMLLHPHVQRVLFLGVGTGITTAAATAYPNVEVDAVELVPEILELLGHFAPDNDLRPGRQVRWHVADARRFVRATSERWDVIVGDLFHPARDGAGVLYTVEHFAAVGARLAPGGLFCQWLPLHQLDGESLRIIIRSFIEVFEHSSAFYMRHSVRTPMLALVGYLDGVVYPSDPVARRRADPWLAARLREAGFSDQIQVLGCHAAGPGELRRLADHAPLNRDDLPLVMYRIPAFTYRKDQSKHGRLQHLLEAWPAPSVRDLTDNRGRYGQAWARRVDAYIAARVLYQKALIRIEEGLHDERTVVMLLASAGRSGDFPCSFDYAYAIAKSLARTEPVRSSRMLAALRRIKPQDPRWSAAPGGAGR